MTKQMAIVVIGSLKSVLMCQNNCWIKVANIVDSDQMLTSAVTDLGLHCLHGFV